MKKIISSHAFLLFLALCSLPSIKAVASHFYGADLNYTHDSGNRYIVTLTVFGDCGGSSFAALSGATPEIRVLNGSSLYTTMNLAQVGNGVEVTPVCPSQANSTNCSSTSSSIPGVKRYIYSGKVTLNAYSANWKFRFSGTMSSTSTAGRSNSITNIVTGSTTALEALLNNSSAPNSSVSYTTIPTPFFCINKAANYSPGAVDPNLDSLSFSLITGLNGTAGTVTYVSPYTATAPLSTNTGTYSFSSTNGQISFNPNATQRALIVSQASEYRNGVLVGTSMREMTFVVLSTCNNNPPVGVISSPSTGLSSINGTTVAACASQGLISFQINPTDSDGNHIDMQVSGLPLGATFTITGNNGYTPSGAFSWNITNVTPGTYNFFVTFTDDGCPLSSKQSLAYTVIVYGPPAPGFSLISVPTCNAKAKFSLTPANGAVPYRIIVSGGAVADTFKNVTTSVTDSVSPGTYVISTRSSIGCSYDTTITISPPAPVALAYTFVKPLCYNSANGSVTISGSGGWPGYTYAVDASVYATSGTFTGLSAGAHVLHVKDTVGCIKDSNIILLAPSRIVPSVAIRNSTCATRGDGVVTLSASGGTPGYTYAKGTGAYGASGTFPALAAGTYTFHIKDTAACIVDTTITIRDSLVISGNVTITNVACYAQNNGSITVSGTGGQTPYKYALGTGTYDTASRFSPLANSTYVLHIRDSNGCILDTTLAITQPALLVPKANVTHAICNSTSTGVVTVGATGGTPGYTYAVGSGAYGTSGTFSALAAGTYAFHIKDTHNCVADTTITITQPTAVAVTIAKTNVRCNGTGTGTITVAASGGTPGYSYALDTGAYGSSNLITGLFAGTYTVHIKDTAGCVKDTVVTITEPASLAIGYTSVRPLCNGQSNGSVTISASGGTTPYLYAVGSGSFSTTTVYNGLAAGTYVLHIKDANNCTKDSTIILGEPAALAFTLAITNVSCYGDSSGTVTVTATGGTPPYYYAANSGVFDTSRRLVRLPAGVYAIHLKDTLGCTKDSNINITQPPLLKLAYSVVSPLCNGDRNGSITISGSGGTSPYQYALDTSAFRSTGLFGSLLAGNYILHIRDTVGCVKDSLITLTQPARLSFTLAITNVLCNGGNTGVVTVTASGGTGPYQYAANSNALGGNNVLTGFSVGVHTIHLKDANGCTKDTTITITEPAILGLGYIATQPLCNGESTGKVVITGTGGTVPYSFAVNTGSFGSSGTITGLPAGTHTLHIRDANGCLKDSIITIGEPTAITVTAAVKRARCTPLVNGYVWLTAGGGTPGYTYAIGTGTYGSSSQFNNLASGTYTFHIKDSNGCIKDTIISVLDSVFVHATYTVTNVSCFAGSDGVVSITPSGGDMPYTYAVGSSAYSTTNPITSLSAGAYMLHVKDSNGCILDTPLSINQPSKILPNVFITQPYCYGGNTGNIQIAASGGTPGYTFALGGGSYSSTGAFYNLIAGTYTLHVKDANGCIRDTTVTMDQPTQITYDSVSITDVKCNGDNSGTVTVYAHGGTPPYTYARDNTTFGASNLLTGFYAGRHLLHIKDANGCLMDTSVTVNEPTHLHFRVPGITQPTCEGYKDGSITISAFGGTPQYLYAMDPQPYKPVSIYPGLGAGTYTFHIQDSNLCVHDTTIVLTGNPPIVLGTPEITQPACYGFNNGSINLQVSGGVQPLTYHAVSPPMTNNTGIFDSLRRGTYTFNITDAAGCRKDTTLVMAEPPLLTVTSEATPNDCEGKDDGGRVTALVSGGTPPYAYAWSNELTGNEINGVPNGTYWVRITDANGCQDSSLAVVGYDDCCKPFVPDAFTPNGDGKNDIFRLRWKGDVSKLQLSVYNRFGERVFVSYQADVGWDGTYHGKPCDMGVYFYVVKFICGTSENNNVQYKGDVTLIR